MKYLQPVILNQNISILVSVSGVAGVRERKYIQSSKLNEARIDEIRRTRPHLTYPGMVYYGERMNELRGAETEEVK